MSPISTPCLLIALWRDSGQLSPCRERACRSRAAKTWRHLGADDGQLLHSGGVGCCDDMMVAICAGLVEPGDDAEGELVDGAAVVRSSGAEIAGLQATRCPWCRESIELELREVEASAGGIVVIE